MYFQLGSFNTFAAFQVNLMDYKNNEKKVGRVEKYYLHFFSSFFPDHDLLFRATNFCCRSYGPKERSNEIRIYMPQKTYFATIDVQLVAKKNIVSLVAWEICCLCSRQAGTFASFDQEKKKNIYAIVGYGCLRYVCQASVSS